MKKPVIGITVNHVAEGALPHDRLSLSYVLAVKEAGGIPLLVPNVGDASALSALDGLVVSGGADFDPAQFGQEPRGTHMEGISAERDATEIALLREAAPDLPILGICRGIQAIAVAYGGTLIQDVPSQRPSELVHAQTGARDARTHGVRVAPDSQLGAILGAQEIRVNSFHHQAVDRVPDGFRVVAWADDGLIEGIETNARPFCLGVEWHPENLIRVEEHARRLFAALIEAASKRLSAEAS
jgi:putative glutamine amidotransferase